jgi:hypothetical protein
MQALKADKPMTPLIMRDVKIPKYDRPAGQGLYSRVIDLEWRVKCAAVGKTPDQVRRENVKAAYQLMERLCGRYTQ